MDKVSVIVPVYNSAAYLDRCLLSIIGQTYTDLEIIIVNDGSTDRSVEIITGYERQDARIVVIHQSNKGVSAARNAGIRIATGKYLCFVDGDDALEANYVEEMYSLMTTKCCDLVCTNFDYLRTNGTIEKQDTMCRLPEYLDDEDAIRAFLTQQITGHITKMFKRSICLQNHLFFVEGKRWEDVIFVFAYILHSKRVGIVHQYLYKYYQNDTALTQRVDTLDVLMRIEAARYCVQLNEQQNSGRFQAENRCLMTKAFIGVMLASFKSTMPDIYNRLRREMRVYERNLALRFLSLSEKLLIILYRMNDSLAKWVFLHIYYKRKNVSG
jgi:glycosyltransferase involved in cell wall biosynthesis